MGGAEKGNLLKVLDLGSGYRKFPGALTMDRSDVCAPDMVHDLDALPYPFPDNSFDKIHASHILEHVQDIFKVMAELHRISKPGGKLIIRVPHFSGEYAYRLDHRYFFSTREFDIHFSAEDRRYSGASFQVSKKRLCYMMKTYGEHTQPVASLAGKVLFPFAAVLDFLANLNLTLCERIWCYWVGGFGEVYFELEAIKNPNS